MNSSTSRRCSSPCTPATSPLRPFLEHEADAIGGAPVAGPVRYGASPGRIYPFIWFIAIGAGLYVLLRPSPANAPGPGDQTLPAVSAGQIVLESVSIFAIPGGAFALGGRLGFGFLGSAALAGAATHVGLRASTDMSRGRASPPLLYLFDTITGAAIGFIVPGGVCLLGRAGTYGLDVLATYGLTKSDFALTRLLAEEAASSAGLTAARARDVLALRGLTVRVSQWWFDRRNLILLYRGQHVVTDRIASPLARAESGAASQQLLAHLRSVEGLSDADIAGYTAI
jgi:hypothetical protein